MLNFTVSIIIPTYNRGYCVSRAIESVKVQSSDNWELIIVDDGSTDNTLDILKLYDKHPKIRYTHQKNKGVSAARNNGALMARGEFLIFLDSDDVLLPHLIKKLNEIKFFDYDLICWEVLKIIDGNKKIWKPQKLNGVYSNIISSFLAGSSCYKKTIFNDVGGYDSNIEFGENYELGIRISQIKSLKIKIINAPFLKYHITTKNRSSNSISNRLHSNIYQYQKHRELYNKNLSAKAEINYILGYVLEKSGRKHAAIKQYLNSWSNNPWSLKPILKVLYLKFLK